MARYTLDLPELARQGELAPIVGREAKIAQLIQALSRRRKNNPALIVERLAQRGIEVLPND